MVAESRKPQFPVYIISKGRAQLPQCTALALQEISVPYRIVVEPQEAEEYAARFGDDVIIETPFSNLGQGSIPARNFVWEHAIGEGHEWHWILDDNIFFFLRLHMNRRIRVVSPAPFRIVEDLALRYENVAQAGMHYDFFCTDQGTRTPILWNSRVYSIILIRNDLPYRWRGRYNEDTDLSLRMLKDGWCTMLNRSFIAHKARTMTLPGGNTDVLYHQDDEFDGRYEMAKSLYEQHPDVTTITRKFGRWQHHVNYKPFQNNEPILKSGVQLPTEPNEYGLTLEMLRDGKWVRVNPADVEDLIDDDFGE